MISLPEKDQKLIDDVKSRGPLKTALAMEPIRFLTDAEANQLLDIISRQSKGLEKACEQRRDEVFHYQLLANGADEKSDLKNREHDHIIQKILAGEG